MHNNIDPFAVQAKQTKLYLTIGVALMVVALWLGLLGAGVLGLGSSLGGNVTKSGHSSAPVTPAGSEPPPGITASGIENIPVTVNEQEVKQMPAHILDWLKHLERCERRKVDIAGAEMSSIGVLSAFGSIGGIRPGDFNDPEAAIDKMPGKEEHEKTESFAAQWDELIGFFDSKPAPNECLPIRNSYDQHIGEVKAYLGQIRDIFASLGTDSENIELMQQKLEQCRRMLQDNKSAIDVAGKDADKEVQAICDKYGVRKWFSINSDVGGGLSGVMSGLGGMIGR